MLVRSVNANGLQYSSSVLGFPRMGVNRDLKKATEAYWAGKLSQEALLAEGKRLRLEHWNIQKKAGVDIIPSNDFSFYDQVLDHIQLFGVRMMAGSYHGYISTLTMVYFRLYQRDTPHISLPSSMSSSPWAAVCKSLRKESMSQLWSVSINSPLRFF